MILQKSVLHILEDVAMEIGQHKLDSNPMYYNFVSTHTHTRIWANLCNTFIRETTLPSHWLIRWWTKHSRWWMLITHNFVIITDLWINFQALFFIWKESHSAWTVTSFIVLLLKFLQFWKIILLYIWLYLAYFPHYFKSCSASKTDNKYQSANWRVLREELC